MKITTTLSPTIDEWNDLTWEEFNKILFNSFNSPQSIRTREKNGECDIDANFDLDFINVHNEKCSIEITLNYEGCDYYILAYTQLSNQQWELNENFERDAKTPQRVIEIIKEHLFTSYSLEEKEIA